ncbi:Hypothetical predicted protein [Pelobates cultripes]|uniref:Uncharacterized protein n=1 Tax=Pelobates cultripes TaxID=61616 RepID=A0AAD1SWY7_PELCU|nr:Hypothetical predicted protein [Pelobates cultripes]
MANALRKHPVTPWETKFNAEFDKICAAFWHRIATRAEQMQPSTTPALQLPLLRQPYTQGVSPGPVILTTVSMASARRRMVHRRRKSTTRRQQLATGKANSFSTRMRHSEGAQWILNQVRGRRDPPPQPDGLKPQRHCTILPCGVG